MIDGLRRGAESGFFGSEKAMPTGLRMKSNVSGIKNYLMFGTDFDARYLEKSPPIGFLIAFPIFGIAHGARPKISGRLDAIGTNTAARSHGGNIAGSHKTSYGFH